MKLSLFVLSIIFLFASCAVQRGLRNMETEQAIEEAYRNGEITKREYLELRIKMEQSMSNQSPR
jgi:hypothetical protein